VTLARCFLHVQDTVVALQALAKYASLTYSSNGDFTVTVTSPTGTAQDFALHSGNRLVLQRAALHELPGTYGVRARGQGCALVQVGTAPGVPVLARCPLGGSNPPVSPQVTLRYNVPPPPSVGTFDLRVETEPGECTGDASARFRLLLRAR